MLFEETEKDIQA